MANQNIKGFIKHFTHLNPQQRLQFERIVNDVQGTLDTTSLATDLQQLRRTPNTALPIPQLTVRPTVRGAIIEWEPLPDPRISFYEVEVSDQSNFASFETVTTFGASAVLDGITETKYVRVRGVRNNGETSPRSLTAEINPLLFEVRTHSFEAFYIRIPKQQVTEFAGAESTVEFTPTNPLGYSMVWGGIQMYGDPNTGVMGSSRILMRLFAEIIDEDGNISEQTEVWRNSASEYFGYYSIGPLAVQHGPLNSMVSLRMEVSDYEVGSVNNSRLEWLHLDVFEIGTTDGET